MTEKNVLATRETAVIAGFNTKEGFELMQRAATLLSKSSLVPTEYRNNVANCTIALNMAGRMQADPLMVMQNLHLIQGRPSWSSPFLIASCNTSGKFSPLRYEWKGEPGSDDWGCRAWAWDAKTGDPIYGTFVDIKMAKDEGWYQKKGSKWQTMPQQMLMYRAAAFFVRVHAPEITMGLHTRDEIEDMGDVIDMPSMDDHAYEAHVGENANAETIDMDAPEPEIIDTEPVDDLTEAAKAAENALNDLADAKPSDKREPAF